jgi:hypothetical protein
VTPDDIRDQLSEPRPDLAGTFEEVARRTARLVLQRALEAEVEELLASERQVVRVRRVRVRPVRRALRRFYRIGRVEMQPGATGTPDEMPGLVPIQLPIEVEDAGEDFSWRPPAPSTDEAVRSQVGVFQAVLEAMGAAR